MGGSRIGSRRIFVKPRTFNLLPIITSFANLPFIVDSFSLFSIGIHTKDISLGRSCKSAKLSNEILKTRSAPAATACLISFTFKESMLTGQLNLDLISETNSKIRFELSLFARQPKSITSAPESKKY